MNTGVAENVTTGFNGKKQRDFSHPSVVALLNGSGGTSDPEAIVRRKCRAIVAAAKKDGWHGPPFNPYILASSMGIKVRKVSHDIGAEARIYGTTSQVIIEYRPDLAVEERLRFSICHEIVHTVFPDCYQMVRHSQVNCPKLSEAEKEFELLCDLGAGELLMPQLEFGSDFEKTKFTLNDVCDLKKRYFASTEATMKRCLGITRQPRAAVFFHQHDEQLKVKYYWKSDCFRPFIKPGLVPPSTSVIHNLSFANIEDARPTDAQNELWLSDDKPLKLSVQAIVLPHVPRHPEYPKAMALVAY